MARRALATSILTPVECTSASRRVFHARALAVGGRGGGGGVPERLSEWVGGWVGGGVGRGVGEAGGGDGDGGVGADDSEIV